MADTHPFQPRAHDPDKPAFVMCATGESVSFGQLECRANQNAHLMRQLGVKRGDHIAILMENRREFLEICFAADRAGVYYTTISTHLADDEIAYILSDSAAKLLISSARFRDALPKLRDATGNSCTIYSVDNDPTWPSWTRASANAATSPIADEAQGLDMLYSSGTTGKPKGIKWPLDDDLPGGRTMLVDLLTSLFGYSAASRYLSPAPLYHAAPLRHAMVTIKVGGTAYVMDRFDAVGALKVIEEYSITHSQWVPTMFVRMLKLPEADRTRFDLSSMQMAVHAAAPCPRDVKHQMITWWGPIIHEYYSGTENNGFTAITSQEWLQRPGSVGQAKLGVVHICDDAGREVDAGVEGEIFFENGHQFSYHNAPQKTAACTNAQGWTSLGDIGRMDEAGYLYLTDRKSFLIISGGVNIYPQETENVLLGHPAVLDAAVIGVPSDEFGEDVMAIVQTLSPNAGTKALEAELIEYCQNRLSKLKCPKTIEFRDVLPRSATGKLYKRKLLANVIKTKSPEPAPGAPKAPGRKA